VLLFLADRQRELLRAVLADWQSGKITLAAEQEIRGRCLELSELGDLTLEGLREFYADVAEQSSEES
jgi:hypothetical protein